jgi:hypothetical protein
MEEMSKKTKRLEKDNAGLTKKHDSMNQNIIKMAEERSKNQAALETLRKKNENLEKLCRGMQAQGRGVLPIRKKDEQPQEDDDEDEDATESEYEDEDEDDEDSDEESEDSEDDSDGTSEPPESPKAMVTEKQVTKVPASVSKPSGNSGSKSLVSTPTPKANGGPKVNGMVKHKKRK